MHFLFLLLLFLPILNIVASDEPSAQDGTIKYHWIQIGAEGKRFLRVISTNNQCPVLYVDAKKKEMNLHSSKDRNFNVLSCIYEIANNDKKIKLGIKELDVTRKKINKIMVVGDTGCRINAGHVQDCKNDWKFKQIIEAAAPHKPDLIIHVGDYYYRTKCIFHDACKYEPNGDHFGTWEAELFSPANTLLDGNTPWIFARGNHEGCNIGGGGWMRFLSFGKTCLGKEDDYVVDLDGLPILIMDSSKRENDISDSVFFDEKTPFWVVTHVPFDSDEIKKLPKNLRLILSGHKHELKIYEVDGVIQAILGNGGAALRYNEDKDAIYEYGFSILEKVSDGWLFTARNYDDRILLEHKVKN